MANFVSSSQMVTISNSIWIPDKVVRFFEWSNKRWMPLPLENGTRNWIFKKLMSGHKFVHELNGSGNWMSCFLDGHCTRNIQKSEKCVSSFWVVLLNKTFLQRKIRNSFIKRWTFLVQISNDTCCVDFTGHLNTVPVFRWYSKTGLSKYCASPHVLNTRLVYFVIQIPSV